MTIEKLTEQERRGLHFGNATADTAAKALRIIDQLTAENDRLRAELERLRAELALERAAHSVTVSVASGETERLRAYAAACEETAAANQRENVELKTQALMARGVIEGLVTERNAANALLERVYDWQGPLGLTVSVMNAIKAHLAGQEAAPVKCSQCGFEQGNAPYGCDCDRKPTRTEAEQRVLDACAAAELREMPGSEGWALWTGTKAIVAAELARRGLKAASTQNGISSSSADDTPKPV